MDGLGDRAYGLCNGSAMTTECVSLLSPPVSLLLYLTFWIPGELVLGAQGAWGQDARGKSQEANGDWRRRSRTRNPLPRPQTHRGCRLT